jgi:hypothetical protein
MNYPTHYVAGTRDSSLSLSAYISIMRYRRDEREERNTKISRSIDYNDLPINGGYISAVEGNFPSIEENVHLGAK